MNNIASMKVNINSFEEKKIDGGKNNVVFYKMQIGFTKNNKSWYLDKRYSDFDTLNTQLKDFYPNMPELPAKTLFKLSNQAEIAQRMENLNKYMKALINRRDMRTSPVFRKFIAIEMHFSQSRCFEPKKIANMTEFGKGVRDFIYLPQYQTGFVALSDMNIISRMDSYFTNVSTTFHFIFRSQCLGRKKVTKRSNQCSMKKQSPLSERCSTSEFKKSPKIYQRITTFGCRVQVGPKLMGLRPIFSIGVMSSQFSTMGWTQEPSTDTNATNQSFVL